MSNDRQRDTDSRSSVARLRHLARLFALALIITAGLVAWVVLPLWFRSLAPRWLVRWGSVVILWTMLATYVLGVLAVLIGGVWSCLAVARARSRHDMAALRQALRWALLLATCLVGLIATEWVSRAGLRRLRRLPDLPTRFAQPSNRVSPRSGASADELYLVVVGESSARGDPYDPWLSVGQIVGWQLERVFPGRKIVVDVRAIGGVVLEQAVERLYDLERRPDAIFVLAGHNEFQGRYGWSRNVSHYVEEGPGNPLAWLDFARSTSWTARLILSLLDQYYGEAPPPPRITRTLVDHPICGPREYAFLREDFQVRLDSLTDYCARIGSLPILIMPGSNDGSFEPNRSVLAASTSADARAAFEREFRRARAAERDGPEASIASYRRLVAQHPEFAETHYRLARLLAATGARDEARHHFVLARDLDGFPLRCPTDFREAYRSVARRYGAVLIDGPEVLSRVSPHGILDDHLFHDGQHVNFIGIVALSNEILEQLRRRRAFGWPESMPAPRVELQTCARHFELDSRKWANVLERAAEFHALMAYVRFDPAERLKVADRNHQAAVDLGCGRPPRDSTLPSVALAVKILESSPTTPPDGQAPSSP